MNIMAEMEALQAEREHAAHPMVSAPRRMGKSRLCEMMEKVLQQQGATLEVEHNAYSTRHIWTTPDGKCVVFIHAGATSTE